LQGILVSSDNAQQAPHGRYKQPMESIVGQTVSHYAFLEKLGAGGMGEIYKARDSRLNRIVAVKVLAPGRTRDPERRRRFIQEAQAASGLNHPNIITIHDILSQGEVQYMVMEHVSGQTLQALITAGRLPVAHVLQISSQMANALAVAHAAGIIHRDLKPANVMVTNLGLVKILDFGLAKLMDPMGRVRSLGEQTDDPATQTAGPLTVEGAIMGTVNYMSPEQAEGLKVDARSDIFSFGAVLYEMVTGQRAFDGDSVISALSAVLRDEAKPIWEFATDVPAELNDLIWRCLRKNPGERWQWMAEVAAALNSMRARLDSGIVLRTVGPPVPRSPVSAPKAVAAPRIAAKKLVSLGGVALTVVALAAVGAWWQTHRPTPTPPIAASPPPTTQAAPPAVPPEVGTDAPPVAGADAQAGAQGGAQGDAPAPIETRPAPPPYTPIVPLASKLKTPLPPPVTVTKAHAVPLVAATPAAPVAAAPVPKAPPSPEIVPVKLEDGLPFRIALLDDVPSDIDVGHALRFRVLDDVKSDDLVVIAKGAIVTGSVVALGGKRNFFFGERSKVRFRLSAAESVDDGNINVRAIPAPKNDGEDRPFETPKGSKDKSLIAASGTEYVAYVAGEQTVHVRK